MTDTHQNWAHNLTYSAARVHRPETLEQLQEIVRGSDQVKALGTRHSFNTVADTKGDHISLEHFASVVALDPTSRTVTIGGGMRYGELGRHIDAAGFALHNLASLPHISVAGACATATHGSGVKNGCLATVVRGLEIVRGDGELVRLKRGDEDFAGAVVGLGALGVVTQLTLDVVPAYEMRQEVYEHLPLRELEANFAAIVESGYSVSLFTDWTGDAVSQVWIKRQVDDSATFELAPELFGAALAPTHRHPIRAISPENCTPQMGLRGPWYERLPHFRLDFMPSAGDELQTEYLVPREHAWAAFSAIQAMGEQISPVLQISEIRMIAADELWMSPFYQQPCIALHFTWKPDWASVRQLLPRVEATLEPFGARPHWGKLFTMERAAIAAGFPRLPDFQRLAARFDPTGKFRNEFLDASILAPR